ncbi:MAG: helix-turn-helix transcriptional regulator [Coriobacteriales bacterium]|nr:helix-turn-helix transcriptional regulator [Coriobacteriales bacterium]
MTDNKLSVLGLARLASGLTREDAAHITGMSIEDYCYAETHPFTLSVGELQALCHEFNADGKQIILEWVGGFFGLR